MQFSVVYYYLETNILRDVNIILRFIRLFAKEMSIINAGSFWLLSRQLRDIHFFFIIEKTMEGRSIKYISMNEKIPLGFTTILICGCGLKESEWQEDETLIGKVRRRESRDGGEG